MKDTKDRTDQVTMILNNLVSNLIPNINKALLLYFNQEDKN